MDVQENNASSLTSNNDLINVPLKQIFLRTPPDYQKIKYL